MSVGSKRPLRPTVGEVAGLGLDAGVSGRAQAGCFHLPSSGTAWPHPVHVEAFAAELGVRVGSVWDHRHVEYSTLPHTQSGSAVMKKMLRSTYGAAAAQADMIVWLREQPMVKLHVHVVLVHPVWYRGWWSWRVDEEAAATAETWNEAALTLFVLATAPQAGAADGLGREFGHAFTDDVYFYPVVHRPCMTPGEAVISAAAAELGSHAPAKTPFSAHQTLYGITQNELSRSLGREVGAQVKSPRTPATPPQAFLSDARSVDAPGSTAGRTGTISPVVFTDGRAVESAAAKPARKPAPAGPLYLLNPERDPARARLWCLPVACVAKTQRRRRQAADPVPTDEHLDALRCCVPASRPELLAELFEAELRHLQHSIDAARGGGGGPAAPPRTPFTPLHTKSPVTQTTPGTFTIGGGLGTHAASPAQRACPLCGTVPDDLSQHLVDAHWRVDTTLQGGACGLRGAGHPAVTAESVRRDAEFLGLTGPHIP